jgi:hypothetical protein
MHAKLTEMVQIKAGLPPIAAAAADRTSAIIDTQGFNTVVAVTYFGAIAAGAVTSTKVQQGAVANMSDAADLLGSGQTVAADDDNQLFATEIFQPGERYIRAIVDKDTSNNTIEAVFFLLFRRDNLPVPGSVTDEVTVESHITPAEGTA